MWPLLQERKRFWEIMLTWDYYRVFSGISAISPISAIGKNNLGALSNLGRPEFKKSVSPKLFRALNFSHPKFVHDHCLHTALGILHKTLNTLND